MTVIELQDRLNELIEYGAGHKPVRADGFSLHTVSEGLHFVWLEEEEVYNGD